jgi:hypothetical protein
MAIDRYALVTRHDVVLSQPDGQTPLTVGNGDFGFTADITGLQTFTSLHDPMQAQQEERIAVNTTTMSTWGWHEMPNPEGYRLEDTMTDYQTTRGPVRYPDRFDIATMFGGAVAPGMEAGVWLIGNPHRLDLGRLGFVLGAGEAPGFTPDELSDVEQRLRLWDGLIDTRFTLRGQPVEVTTAVHPVEGRVAVRVSSPLCAGGELAVALRFPYGSDNFFLTSDWSSPERHTTTVTGEERSARIERQLDATRYEVGMDWNAGTLEADEKAHIVVVRPSTATFELVASFGPTALPPAQPVGEILAAASTWWNDHWTTGAVVDFAGSTDPRAAELERRVVLSQYLMAANCSGVMPPQESGLITNSWQGKSHLEIHFWHAGHFALWGRPQLLARSLDWYLSILDEARAIAREQGYEGARWPKQIGPEGRQSPNEIGPFLIWQQPHLLYLLEVLHAAGAAAAILEKMAVAVEETAAFMASFVEERDGTFHLSAPLLPAQEFYDRRTVEDPTFELAYWWWGLEIAQRWRERRGEPRNPRWTEIQDGLARPHVTDGRYDAIATKPYLKRVDHPSMLGAFGFVPPTPLVEPEIVRATLQDVLREWDWSTSWGWDYPVMAMAATRLGDPQLAVDSLLLETERNRYTAVGHNPVFGNAVPVYLPANGSLLSAVSLMIAGWAGAESTVPGFPRNNWRVEHEGFIPWPDSRET